MIKKKGTNLAQMPHFSGALHNRHNRQSQATNSLIIAQSTWCCSVSLSLKWERCNLEISTTVSFFLDKSQFESRAYHRLWCWMPTYKRSECKDRYLPSIVIALWELTRC